MLRSLNLIKYVWSVGSTLLDKRFSSLEMRQDLRARKEINILKWIIENVGQEIAELRPQAERNTNLGANLKTFTG